MTPAPRTLTIFTRGRWSNYWSPVTTVEVKRDEKAEDAVRRACEKLDLDLFANQIILAQWNEDDARRGALLAFRLGITLSIERLENA